MFPIPLQLHVVLWYIKCIIHVYPFGISWCTCIHVYKIWKENSYSSFFIHFTQQKLNYMFTFILPVIKIWEHNNHYFIWLIKSCDLAGILVIVKSHTLYTIVINERNCNWMHHCCFGPPVGGKKPFSAGLRHEVSVHKCCSQGYSKGKQPASPIPRW